MSDKRLCWPTGKLEHGECLPLSGFFDTSVLNPVWHTCGSGAISIMDSFALVLTANSVARQTNAPQVIIATSCPDQARLVDAMATDLFPTKLLVTCSSESRSAASLQVIIDISRLAKSASHASGWWPSLTWWERDAIQKQKPGTWLWGSPGDIEVAAQEAPWAAVSIASLGRSRVILPATRPVLTDETGLWAAGQSRKAIDLTVQANAERVLRFMECDSNSSVGPSLVLCPIRKPPLVQAVVESLPATSHLSSNNAQLCASVPGCLGARNIISSPGEAVACTRLGWLLVEPTTNEPVKDHLRSTLLMLAPRVCTFLTHLSTEEPVCVNPPKPVTRVFPLPRPTPHKKKHRRKKRGGHLLGTRVAGPAVVYKGRPAPSLLVLDVGLWGNLGAKYDLAATLAATAFIQQVVREGATVSDLLAIADTPQQSRLLTNCLGETGLGGCRVLYEGVLTENISARGIVLVLSRPVSVENLLACYEHLQNAPMCIICHVRNNTAGFAGDQCSRVCYTIVPATAACIASMAGPDAPWVKLPDGPVELSSADEAQAITLGHIGSMRIAMMASHTMLFGGTATNLADVDGAALVISLPRMLSKLLSGMTTVDHNPGTYVTSRHSAVPATGLRPSRHDSRHYDDPDWFDTPGERAAQERRQGGKISYSDVGIKRQSARDYGITSEQMEQLRKRRGTPGEDQ